MPTTTTTTTTTTTIPPDSAECPGDGDCIVMLSAGFFDDGTRVIVWSSSFDITLGTKHAHFFWDIYRPDQVGTASADRAPWELTFDQGFTPSGELLESNRPAGATGICVTPADGNHTVIDPAYYHCIELEPGGSWSAGWADEARAEQHAAAQAASG